MIKLAGFRIAIRHIVYEGGKLTKDGRAFLDREQPDICIFGHTHQPKKEWYGKTLLFNPGSAGRNGLHCREDSASSQSRLIASSRFWLRLAIELNDVWSNHKLWAMTEPPLHLISFALT